MEWKSFRIAFEGCFYLNAKREKLAWYRWPANKMENEEKSGDLSQYW